MNRNHLPLRLAVASALLAASTGAIAAEAQETKLEEVVVSAQKVSERLLDVPVAITAVQSEDLTQENLVSVIDYFSRIPNLQYNCRQTYCLSLRGITTGNATNPTVGILIDDVPFGSALQAGLGNSRFPDLDPSTLNRLEVLRGPQGTLYGASTIGGLIKYVTRPPQTDEFSGRIEAGLASVDGGDTDYNLRGSVNLPFWGDKAALLVSGFDRNDPAYMDNVRPGFEGEDVNKTHIYGGNAALLLKLTDDLDVTLSYLRQKRDADYTTSVQSLPATPGLTPTFVPRYGEDNLSLTPSSDVGDQELYSARVVWDLGGVELTSISAWSQSDGTNYQDLSNVFTFIPLFYGYPPGSSATVNIVDIAGTNKFSQELRAAGTFGSVDWLAGLFYTDEDGSVDQTLNLSDPDGSLVAIAFAGKNPFTYEETAVFANATWHVTSAWELQGGVRVGKNKQTSGSKQIIDDPMVPIFGPSGEGPSIKSDDDSFTFELAPSYHFNDDLMAYFRVASGYRPGGPNIDLPNVPSAYDPDSVVNYELGMKGLLFEDSFSYDVALFQINWSDIQLLNTDSASQFTYTTNGGKAVSRGFEGSIQYRPFERTTFGANLTLLDAQLSQSLPVLVGADSLLGEDGDQLPGSAEVSGNLSIEQGFSLTDSMDLTLGANMTYVGERRSEFVNSGALLEDGSLAPRWDLPDYTQFDLRASLTLPWEMKVDAYVRNVTDEDGVVTANNRNGTNTASVVFLQPRTYGLSVSKSF